MKKVFKYPKHIYNAIIDYDFSGRSAEMGFMLVLGIFPFMLFLVAVFGWLGHKTFMNSVLLFLSNIMPIDAMNLIRTVLREVMIFSKGGLMGAIGFVVTLFLTSNAVAVVLKGLNTAY